MFVLVLPLASQHGLSSYDAAYLELALRKKAPPDDPAGGRRAAHVALHAGRVPAGGILPRRQHGSTLSQHAVHLRGAHYSSSHTTAKTVVPPAVGTRLMYGAPPPSRSPTSPGALPPAPGSRWPHMGRDD